MAAYSLTLLIQLHVRYLTVFVTLIVLVCWNSLRAIRTVCVYYRMDLPTELLPTVILVPIGEHIW